MHFGWQEPNNGIGLASSWAIGASGKRVFEMLRKVLTALPVYNESAYVEGVLEEVLRYCAEVLVVDDGSTDATPELLARRKDVYVVRHPRNFGYGAALRTAFEFAIQKKYETLITIDCDRQHQPHLIPQFLAARTAQVDMVSGSRYLRQFPSDSPPPADRRRINRIFTQALNRLLGLEITDAFCGFKAYRVDALRAIRITEPGYAMPLELWVQAARLGWKIVEVPVPRIYLEEKRSFGGALDDPATRLRVYRQVFRRALMEHGFCLSGEPAQAERSPPEKFSEAAVASIGSGFEAGKLSMVLAGGLLAAEGILSKLP